MIGVVADDFTGANDIGIMFALNGYRTYVYSVFDDSSILPNDADVLILNTNSRLDSTELAYQKVGSATRTLKNIGCATYFKKTCSVFRGNIGAEFDAMLDELNVEFCCVILGFPKNGRFTKNGIHYVYGNLLEDSAFKDDPVNPMRESNLVSILQKQTRRKVGLLDHSIVRRGVDSIKQSMTMLRKEYSYLIFDVTSQEDLFNIAGAVKDEIALAGSSAIGEELPKWLSGTGKGTADRKFRVAGSNLGTLVIAGSVTPQTKRQIEFAKAQGLSTLMLPTEGLMSEASKMAIINEISIKASAAIALGRNLIIHTENDLNQINDAKEIGMKRGLDERAIGRLISSTLSEIVKIVSENVRLSKLITLGGETSGVICDGLGIYGNLVLKEITPGIPSVLTIGKTELLMAPKSGSFGEDDFIIKALEHLEELE